MMLAMELVQGASSSGHVFVARGRVENVVHDAVVVPTDRAFSARQYWWPVVGVRTVQAPRALRPRGWGDGRRVGRAADGRPVWFLLTVRTLVERLADGAGADVGLREGMTRRG